MTDAAVSGERFEFGRVVGQTFSLIGKNFVWFLLLALIFVGIPRFGVSYAQAYFLQSRPELFGWVTFGGAVVALVTTYILQGALTRAAVDDLSGRGVRLGAAIGDGFANFFPLFIVAILVGLGVGLGFIALIVPALVLAVRWAVAAPAVVMERVGPTGAMGRSAELTEGHRWAIFGLLLLYLVFAYALQIGLALLITSMGATLEDRIALSMSGFIVGALGAASSAVVTLISSVGTASLYFELRRVKDGVGVEDLAKVFD
jgi:hypothetical protein